MELYAGFVIAELKINPCPGDIKLEIIDCNRYHAVLSSLLRE